MIDLIIAFTLGLLVGVKICELIAERCEDDEDSK